MPIASTWRILSWSQLLVHDYFTLVRGQYAPTLTKQKLPSFLHETIIVPLNAYLRFANPSVASTSTGILMHPTAGCGSETLDDLTYRKSYLVPKFKQSIVL